jgi:hypothetical protein
VIEMADVIGFRGAVIPGEPVPAVVDALEWLLAAAQRGEVRGIAYAISSPEGVSTDWVGCEGTRHPLASGVLILHHRYAAGLVDAAQ